MAAGRREEDAGEVERVEDLVCGIPQSGRLQELDVQAGAMADGLPSAQEIGERLQRLIGVRRTPQVLLLDPGQAEDSVRDRTSGIDQPLEGRGHLVGGEGNSADFDDPVAGRVETGGLEV